MGRRAKTETEKKQKVCITLTNFELETLKNYCSIRHMNVSKLISIFSNLLEREDFTNFLDKYLHIKENDFSSSFDYEFFKSKKQTMIEHQRRMKKIKIKRKIEQLETTINMLEHIHNDDIFELSEEKQKIITLKQEKEELEQECNSINVNNEPSKKLKILHMLKKPFAEEIEFYNKKENKLKVYTNIFDFVSDNGLDEFTLDDLRDKLENQKLHFKRAKRYSVLDLVNDLRDKKIVIDFSLASGTILVAEKEIKTFKNFITFNNK